jgi:23S rRNA pseudouridine955/2504/2580 synthase
MAGVKIINVAEADDGIRLDRWFKRHFPALSHGRLERLLRTGQVRVEGGRVKAGRRLEAGETIRLPPLEGQSPDVRPTTPKAKISSDDAEALRNSVLYRDTDVIAIDKPAGLAVQGGSKVGQNLDTMLDALRFDAAERPRLVHRLDKDTSGVLVLARTTRSANWLTQAFRKRSMNKVYWAAVTGLPRPRHGRIDLALEKRPAHGGERVVPDEDGKSAVTIYRTVETAGGKASWLALAPLTGRTHQLRAHCAFLGTPILGDGKYGARAAFIAGADISTKLHLHARALRLATPSGKVLDFRAPLPNHMRGTWRFLGFDENLEADPFAGFID